MDYTIANLRDSEDVAPKFGLSEVGQVRFPREDLSSETVGLAYFVLRPDAHQLFAHRHDEAEEVYLVLAGSGRVMLGEETREIGAMDAIRVAPQVVRSFAAGPDGLELLAFGPRHAGDGEILREDPWKQEAS